MSLIEAQFGAGSPFQESPYRVFDVSVPDAYQGIPAPMPQAQTISFGLFQWVVSLLLAGLAALFWFYMSSLTTDVRGLRQDLGEARIEYTKAIGEVKSQIAVANTKLENILQEMQQHQRR